MVTFRLDRNAICNKHLAIIDSWNYLDSSSAIEVANSEEVARVQSQSEALQVQGQEENQEGSYKPVQIPEFLLPLPDLLLSSRANLLLFHHFITDSAKLLVACDCLENPFKTLMPKRKCDPFEIFLVYFIC